MRLLAFAFTYALLFTSTSVYGQDYAPGDTLYITFEESREVPFYSKRGSSSVNFEGQLASTKAKGDTAFVVDEWVDSITR